MRTEESGLRAAIGEAGKPACKNVNLFSALAAAQPRRPVAVVHQPVICPSDDSTLLSALRNSVTDRDQILQRRLGLLPDIAAIGSA